MKKRSKKLTLNRETVRNLSASHLEEAAGGIPTTGPSCEEGCSDTIPASICNSCKVWCE